MYSSNALWRPWVPVVSEEPTLHVVEARGTRVRDATGRWYLDAISGVLNAVCGHGQEEIIAAATTQMRILTHYDPMVSTHTPAQTLASRLAGLFPDTLGPTLLVNSGSEAMEAALKIAIEYWHNIGQPRGRFVSLRDGYHGTTALTQQLSGLPFTVSPWDPAIEVEHVDLPKPSQFLRSSAGRGALTGAFRKVLLEGTPAAAVVIEPLLGLGGCQVLPDGFLTDLRSICDECGTLLVIDEIFTGFGRTGRMFGFEHESITPDIVTCSKGITSGYVPLASVTAKRQLHESYINEPIAHGLRYGHTTGGHAVAAAVANTVLDIFERDHLVQNSKERGAELLNLLQATLSKREDVVDVRGLGLVVGIEMQSDEAAAKLAERAMRNGVLVRHERGLVRIAPPLTVSERETRDIAHAFAS